MNLAGQGNRVIRGDCGYAMAALLVGLSVMAVLMGMALPVWSQLTKREKEEELIWRGKQYARAVGLFQRKYANTFPPTLDVLIEQKFLRKKYKDPITNDDFQLIPAGGGPQAPGVGGGPQGGRGQSQTQPPTGFTPQQGGRGQQGQTGGTMPGGGTVMPGGGQLPGVGAVNIGIQGVVSKSKETSIKIYNGRQKYNEWTFVYLQTAQAIGPGGVPGVPGRGPAQPGGPFGPMGPGMTPGGRGPGGPGTGRPPVQFPPAPFGQPGQPNPQPPFGTTPAGQRPPTRPPGN